MAASLRSPFECVAADWDQALPGMEVRKTSPVVMIAQM
jgi:hypothetical protein